MSLSERETKAAERAHDYQTDIWKANLSATITFASEALKSAALINGGAAAALLAYIGVGRQDVTPEMISALRSFGTGLLCAAIAHAFAYMTQYAYLWQNNSKDMNFTHPYVHLNFKTKVAGVSAVALHIATLLLLGAAYGLAVWGFWEAASSLRPMPAKVAQCVPIAR